MKRLILVTACLMAATGALAQNVNPSSELGQFRDNRAAGMTALDGGDLETASRRFAAAAAILPDSPSILLLKAQTALQQNRKPEARAALTDYLGRGYVLDLASHPDFNGIWDSNLEDQLFSNQSPVGQMHVTASLPGFNLIEAIAYAPDSEQMYLSQVRSGKIIALTGTVSRDVIQFRPGVAAYGLGLRDNLVWATTAATRQTTGYDDSQRIASKVVVIDPANGQIVNSFSDGDERRLGQLLMGRDDLYVTDIERGEVLRLNGYAGQLQVLIPEGYMHSPMGMVENADASVLIVADFISGLYRIDLRQGTLQRLVAPEGGTTLGFSTLARHGNDLIAIQNGFKPNRIVRLRMSDDWSQIVAVETVLRSKELSQPSQGLVSGDHLLFVARSQWDALDSQDVPSPPQPEPALIGALKLIP